MNATLPAAGKRNFGIDALRILSMFYVVLCHTLTQGGVLGAADGLQRTASGFLYMLTLCCVNIFGMVSGYVGYSEKEKPLNIGSYLLMWLQVVFYGALVTVFFELWNRELVTLRDLMQMFFPVTCNLHWYFTAYTGVFLLTPLINAGIRTCSDKVLKGVFFGILLVFSLYGSGANVFSLGSGYSFLWVLLLYILGAIMKKTGLWQSTSSSVLIIGILVCCSVSTVLFQNWFQKEFLFLRFSSQSPESLIFPTHVLTAIFHVLLFVRLKIGDFGRKLIRFAAPGAFAAYILNTQKFVWEYGIAGRFSFLGDSSVFILVGASLLFAAGFVAVSICIDWFRQKLFALLKLRLIADRVNTITQKWLS